MRSTQQKCMNTAIAVHPYHAVSRLPWWYFDQLEGGVRTKKETARIIFFFIALLWGPRLDSRLCRSQDYENPVAGARCRNRAAPSSLRLVPTIWLSVRDPPCRLNTDCSTFGKAYVGRMQWDSSNQNRRAWFDHGASAHVLCLVTVTEKSGLGYC